MRIHASQRPAIATSLLALFLLAHTQSLLAEPSKLETAADITQAPLTAEQKYLRARQLIKGENAPRNLDEAYRLLCEASGEGHAEATGAIGLFYQNGWAGRAMNNEEAVKWFRKGFEMGGQRASYNYGLMLVNGLGVKADVEQGLPLVQKAAEERIPEACLVYGSYFYFGKFGKSVDYEKALSLMKVAAEAGNPHAQNMVGVMYELGQGTALDEEKAIEWYRKAAEQNIMKAQASLGMLLNTESKDPARRAEALRWLCISAANNEITGIKALQAAVVNAPPTELATAKREARKFQIQMIRAGRDPE